MDAYVPKLHITPPEQSMDLLHLSSGWFIMKDSALTAWGYAHHKYTAQISCQVEVRSINETTKFILEFHLFFCNLRFHLTHPVAIKNDNQGVVQWSKGTTTKKMRWIDLCENLNRENNHDDTISVSHIPGKLNLSDILTKEYHETNHFLLLPNSLMISSQLFSTRSNPSSSTWTLYYHKDALTNS